MLHCHGNADPVVIIDWAEKTRNHITNDFALKNYDLKTYDGVVHTVTPEIINDTKKFINKILPNEPTAPIAKGKLPRDMSVKELKTAIKSANLSNLAVGFTEKKDYVDLLESHLGI